MLAGTIYEQIVSTLQDNPTLKAYVKNVFKGTRHEIDQDSMPCLIIEPTKNNEVELDMNQVKNVYFECDIMAYTHCASEPDKAIVGDDNYKGVLDIENDVRACLQSSYTLGGRVIDTKFEQAVFEYSEYPVRGMLLPIRVLYRQVDNI